MSISNRIDNSERMLPEWLAGCTQKQNEQKKNWNTNFPRGLEGYKCFHMMVMMIKASMQNNKNLFLSLPSDNNRKKQTVFLPNSNIYLSVTAVVFIAFVVVMLLFYAKITLSCDAAATALCSSSSSSTSTSFSYTFPLQEQKNIKTDRTSL